MDTVLPWNVLQVFVTGSTTHFRVFTVHSIFDAHLPPGQATRGFPHFTRHLTLIGRRFSGAASPFPSLRKRSPCPNKTLDVASTTFGTKGLPVPNLGDCDGGVFAVIRRCLLAEDWMVPRWRPLGLSEEERVRSAPAAKRSLHIQICQIHIPEVANIER